MNKFFKTSAIFFIISNVFITTLNADDALTNNDLFKDLKLPQACLPERMQKGAAINNNTCHCPPVSYCTEKVDGNNKLPQFIQNMCCDATPPPTCKTADQDSHFYKDSCVTPPTCETADKSSVFYKDTCETKEKPECIPVKRIPPDALASGSCNNPDMFASSMMPVACPFGTYWGDLRLADSNYCEPPACIKPLPIPILAGGGISCTDPDLRPDVMMPIACPSGTHWGDLRLADHNYCPPACKEPEALVGVATNNISIVCNDKLHKELIAFACPAGTHWGNMRLAHPAYCKPTTTTTTTPANCSIPIPTPPGTICPQDPTTVQPQKCEVHYYKSTEVTRERKEASTHIGTRMFGYCLEYQYTVPRVAADSSNPDGRKISILEASNSNGIYVYTKDNVVADALDELNACLKQIEPALTAYIRKKDESFRKSNYATLHAAKTHLFPFKWMDKPAWTEYYLDQTNTWQREYIEMFNQLMLKDYIEARSYCFAKSHYIDTHSVYIGTLKPLIQDDEYSFNNWALLELSDNVTDEQVLELDKKERLRYSDANRWLVRTTINIGLTVADTANNIISKIFGDNNPANDERKHLVNKFRANIALRPGNNIADNWREVKRYIADKDNDLLFGRKARDIPKFTAKTYGPLNHTTVNQAYGIFSQFMNNTYNPGVVSYKPEPQPALMAPLYERKINDIDSIIGEIPEWFNSKDGWRLIRGISRAIAKTGPDGYFYRNLTKYDSGGAPTNVADWIRWRINGKEESDAPSVRFKNLEEITGEHYKSPPIVQPKDTPIITGTNSNFGNWGINCKKVHFVGLCITTFNKDSSAETCLAPETKVTMGDGTTKLIKDIKAGEAVKGKDGKAVTVESVTELDWGSLTLYNINDGLLRLTADHPIMTKDGWRAVNYHFRNDNHEEDRYGLKDAKPLKVGDVIITEDGEIPVTRIMPEAPVKDGKTFNLKLKDNAKSFFANGIRVRSQN